MHYRRDLLRNAYKSRRELCESRNISSGGLDIETSVCYNPQTKLTSPRDLYETFRRPILNYIHN